jgi:hypothetical protein
MALYLYRKWRQHNNEPSRIGVQNPQSDAGAPSDNGPGFVNRIVRRVSGKDALLFLAIAIPIYLETLDYTGV